MEAPARLTVIVGENGQGKTNLIEAIYCLATGKPLRGGRLPEIVNWEEKGCRILGSVEEEVAKSMEVQVRSGRRLLMLDSKASVRLERYTKVLKVVAFTPDDLQVVKGSAENRRKWLDRAVFTRNEQYASVHRTFRRALRSRNRLLRKGKDTGRVPEELEAFDEAVAAAGARLWLGRIGFVEEMARLIAERFDTISRQGASLEISYQSDLLREQDVSTAGVSRVDLEKCLRVGMRKRRRSDLARGFTTAGPQVDDLAMKLSGHDLRTFGSQGQQRAAVLALKVAEIENLRLRLRRTPVLLLDDVSSELDPGRNAHLLGYLAGFPGQVWMTTTDPQLASAGQGPEARCLTVEDGKVSGEGVRSLEISPTCTW